MSVLITGSAGFIGITAIQGPLRCPCHSAERAWRRGPHHYRPPDTRTRLARGIGMSGGDAGQGLRLLLAATGTSAAGRRLSGHAGTSVGCLADDRDWAADWAR